MYASIGTTAGTLVVAAMIPGTNVLLQAARLSLAVAGLAFACYSIVLLSVAVRSALSS